MKYYLKRPVLILLMVTGLLIPEVQATHIRSADISIERICGTNTFEITITCYLNSLSTTQFGGWSTIHFGDGQQEGINQLNTFTEPRPDLGENVSVGVYTIRHDYPSGIFTLTYFERDRSPGILNVPNSHDVAYVSAITFNTDPKYGCNNFPRLTIPPLDRACSGIAFYHSPGAVDAEGDSLSYEITRSSSDVDVIVPGYSFPNDTKFYTDFENGNETKDGAPTYTIDTTGTLTWNAPGAAGEYAAAFMIKEWRKNTSGVFELISTTIRDMQILVEECENERPDIIIPEALCVIAGTRVTGEILGIDAENHPVKIELVSEVFDFAPEMSPATYSPNDGQFRPSSPSAVVNFTWNTNCLHIRQQPYQIVVKITDDPATGPSLVTFKTWTIRVVAPPPQLTAVQLNVVKKYGVLSWQPYSCTANKIQVWRKVGSFPHQPGNCKIGIPKNSDYSLVAEIDGSLTGFIDTNHDAGLSPGAQYCYRLVALVADTKSIVSQELCIGPIQRDAPVITNVSVDQTAKQEGSIIVSWTSAVDLNTTQFPPPYQYHVYRAKGFFGEDEITFAGYVSDTTFSDASINTEDDIFNYRVVIYSKPIFSDDFIPVDTSAVASSVRLTGTPGTKQIGLQWQDSVPWTTVVGEHPYHYIYRAKGMAPKEALVLIDSVNVIDEGFEYLDHGQFQNQPLAENDVYTYRIETTGTYGNPAIPIQRNFSQTIVIGPISNIEPCPPQLTVALTNCETYKYDCTATLFKNELEWIANEDDTCRLDIVKYNIYAANEVDGEYELIASVNSMNFEDKDIATPARCYKISTIDSRGHESELSAAQCNDACPLFTLPNVFTPNGDGCNDLFSARNPVAPPSGCPNMNSFNCPRFVRSVSVKIYNRWGREVYRYTSSDPTTAFVDWDGRDENGKEMATGIYYYVGEVEFNVIDKEKQKMKIKDWLHLVR